MDMQIGNPGFVYLLACSVVALALVIGASVVRSRAATKFASAPMRSSLLPTRSLAVRWLAPFCVVACTAFLVLALLDIRWGKTTRDVPQKGIEVMFALDVSRSMLAEDAAPNRLQRAKQQIKDMVDEMAGDRIGLVVFAGEADQAVPLTSHYDDFKQILDTVGPQSVMRGGSRLGAAIQTAADGFIGKTNDHKTIVLFTDGEDQESQPVKLARQLHAGDGTRIFTVGLGDLEQGSRIPNGGARREAFVVHEGEQVWSKLNGQILRAIATETEGAYIPAGTKRVDMADVYHGYIANVEQSEFETAKIKAYIPRFQWFAGAALSFLFVELWLTTRAGDGTPRSDSFAGTRSPKSEESSEQVTERAARQRPLVGAASLLIGLLFPLPAEAEPDPSWSIPQRINAATRLLKNEQYPEAINAFNEIEGAAQHRDELNYNSAIAHYRNGDLAAAEGLFRNAAASANSRLAADSRFNLGNSQYSQALEMAQADATAAIEKLKSAVASYRGSLRIDPENADARANIELAGQLIRQLQQRQDQEQKQQQSSSPNDKTQEKQDQQQDEREDESGQSSDQNQQQTGDGEESSEDQNESEGKAGDSENSQEGQRDDASKESSSESSGEPSSENDDSSQTPSSQESNATAEDDAASQAAQASDEGEAKETESTGDPTQSEDEPEQPTDGKLTSENAIEEAAADGKTSAVGVTEATDGAMTKEEALKMLQSIRDRDMIRRLRQQQRERVRRIPVEKDW
jgi:Ca-activated chloride channel family protein